MHPPKPIQLFNNIYLLIKRNTDGLLNPTEKNHLNLSYRDGSSANWMKGGGRQMEGCTQSTQVDATSQQDQSV